MHGWPNCAKMLELTKLVSGTVNPSLAYGNALHRIGTTTSQPHVARAVSSHSLTDRRTCRGHGRWACSFVVLSRLVSILWLSPAVHPYRRESRPVTARRDLVAAGLLVRTDEQLGALQQAQGRANERLHATPPLGRS
jgi:hypothetical protein